MSDRPKFSVCEFTTPDTSFEEDIQLVQLVDADMGVVEPKLIAGEEQAQAEALHGAGLRATVCIPDNISPLPCEAYPGPTDIDVRVAAAELGKPNVGICLDVFNVFKTDNWMEDSERLGLEHDGDKALWRRPPDEIVRVGRAGFDKAWEESQR
jgi:hypothetical protein